MHYFQGEDEVFQIELRANTRVLSYCPAELRMPSGDRSGQLTNISAGGVRMKLPDPPRTGVSAFLEWKSFKSFCRVVRSTHDACELVFERPVPESVVIETSGQEPRPPQPEADLRNIPLGNKRSSKRGGLGAELDRIPLGNKREPGLKRD